MFEHAPPTHRSSPFRPTPAHDASLLRALFRGAKFPNFEWWCHVAHLTAASESGGSRELTLSVIVQLSAAPLRGETASAMIAVRDEQTGEAWFGRSDGRMSGTRAARYAAPGWLAVRLDPDHETFSLDAIGVGISPEQTRETHPLGCYVVQVHAPHFEIDLCFAYAHGVCLSSDGWLDHNPAGSFPLWTAGKLRQGAVSGTLRLGCGAGAEANVSNVRGISRFEQRCVVLSESVAPLLVGPFASGFALQQLRNLTSVRLRWSRLRVEIELGISLCVECLWDAGGERALVRRAWLLDETSTAPLAITLFEAIDATATSLGWELTQSDFGLPIGRYELSYVRRGREDRRLTYPLGWIADVCVSLCDVEIALPTGARMRIGLLETAAIPAPLGQDAP